MRDVQDTFGRRIEYLRLSVTERCNFRCAYCLPNGSPRRSGPPPLSLAEIERLVSGFVGLGLWKVRLTGGEPTVRTDIVEIVRRIAATPGVRRVGLTTNGYRLAAIASELRDAGLTSLNVSVDSLDPARFTRITGSSLLESIVSGAEAALAAGIPSVKVNVVLLRGMDDRELDRFLAWTREKPLAVRFIELMETGDNADFFRQYHVPADEIRERLEDRGWAMLPKDRNDGPATSFGHPDHRGKAGIIAPYSPGFCEGCNRVRVSSTGNLRLCLFGDVEIPLRPYLQDDRHRDDLMRVAVSSIQTKPESHLLRLGRYGTMSNLALIGG